MKDHIAEYIAGELKQIGWNVERREVEGSRFPQRVGPWVGWLGYGALVTFGYILLLRRWPLLFLASFPMLLTTIPWLNAIICNQLSLGRRRRPLETAPLLIGSLVGEPSQAVRVVFQAVLSGLKTDYFQSLRPSRFWIVSNLNFYFWLAIILASLPGLYYRRYLWLIMFTIVTLFFVLIWGLILYVLHWEYSCSGPTTEVGVAEAHAWRCCVWREAGREAGRDRSSRYSSPLEASDSTTPDRARSCVSSNRKRHANPRFWYFFSLRARVKRFEYSENAPLSSGLRDLAKDSAASLWIPTWATILARSFRSGRSRR